MKGFIDALAATLVAFGLIAVAPSCAAADAGRWSYTGPNGPPKWGKLEKDYAACASGKEQSPIDIPDANARKGDLPPLLFNYKPSPLKIEDNGHTIQVNYAPGSFLTVEGKRYELVEFDFHKPSEFKVSGKGQEMAVHLVHRDKDGKLAIVAVFLDQGKENPLVKTLWSNLPQTKGKENVGRRRRDQRRRPVAAEQGLLHVQRVADDPALHGEHRVVRAENPRADLRRRDRALCPVLPDERASGAAAQRSGHPG